MKLSGFIYICAVCIISNVLFIACKDIDYKDINSNILTEYGMNGRVRQLQILDNGVTFYSNLDSIYLGRIQSKYFNDFIENNYDKDVGDFESGQISLLKIKENSFIAETTYSNIKKQKKLKQIFDSFKVESENSKFMLFNSGIHIPRFYYQGKIFKMDLNSELYLYSYIFLHDNPCKTKFTKSDLSKNSIKFNTSKLGRNDKVIDEFYYDLDNEIFLMAGESGKYDECFSVELSDKFINHITNEMFKVVED